MIRKLEPKNLFKYYWFIRSFLLKFELKRTYLKVVLITTDWIKLGYPTDILVLCGRFYAMMRQPIILVLIDDHSNNARAAPPHSYVNALDFPLVRHLADYLKELDRNDNLYNEYF